MAEPYSLGEMNVDTAKELFLFLGQVYPFVDEVSKDAYAAKVAALDIAGNPNETENPLPAPAPVAPAITPDAPPAEPSPVANTPTGTVVETPKLNVFAVPAPAATANEPTADTPAATAGADVNAEIAALESQLADAKARASQGS